jgi:hypothetical protein
MLLGLASSDERSNNRSDNWSQFHVGLPAHLNSTQQRDSRIAGLHTSADPDGSATGYTKGDEK